MGFSFFLSPPNEGADHGADRQPHVFSYIRETAMFFVVQPERQKSSSFGHDSTCIAIVIRIVNRYLHRSTSSKTSAEGTFI
jgi:hypothetical protein